MAKNFRHMLQNACLATALTAMLASCVIDNQQSSVEKSNHTGSNQTLQLWPQLQSPIVYSQEDQVFVANLLARMSTEQKVGQILQAEIQAITPAQAKQYHIGSILNGGGSTPNRNPAATAKDWAEYAQLFYQATASNSEDDLAIPVLWGTDAVHGHGNLEGATIFPHNIGLGAANNPELVRQIGEATALEVRASGIEWVFGPSIAVARNDRWGRTYESYSESPTIVAELGVSLVEGLQGKVGSSAFLDEQHVLASVKHFIGDGGTTDGDDQGNTQISEAELIDIHGPGYFATLDAGALSLMASFSSVNGEKMHGNRYLLTDVLRKKLDFNGLVVGDWNGHGQLPGCTNENCPQALNAGLDLYMVVNDWESMFHNLIRQLDSGEIKMAKLDESVTRILLVKKALGLFDGKGPLDRKVGGDNSVIGSEAHRQIARQAVRESLVLLKNNSAALPIDTSQHVLVTGPGANDLAMQAGGWTVTWQGTGTQPEDHLGATSIFTGFQHAFENSDGTVELSIDGSFEKKPDVAVVVFGEQPYAEGQGDLTSLEFQAGDKRALALLKKLKAQGIKVVSVFLSGRPLWVNPEINASDAFIAAWLPGSEGAGIADVLVANEKGRAEYDFTGKLSFSWPKHPLQAEVNVGDDNYDPQFAFGYGLTYQDHKPLGQLNEQIEVLANSSSQDINLYMGRPLLPWTVFIRNNQTDQAIGGAFSQLNDGSVTVKTMDKDVQEDALLLTFKGTRSSGLYLANGSLDLSNFVDNGTLEIDIRVDEISNGSLSLSVDCQPHCFETFGLRDWAMENQAQGWKHLSIPVSCLVNENTNLTNIRRPLDIHTAGKGSVAIANIQYKLNGEPNMSCLPRDELAYTPSPLNEHWSADWWMPRHHEKLEQARSGSANLLMIGDSITHGWENAGKQVWQQYFKDVNTLNLGFSGDRTENVLWRLQNGAVDSVSPKLAVLMIGTNNTGHRMDSPEAIRDGVAAILTELELRIADSEVLLLAIFPRGDTVNDQLRVNNQKANVLLKQLAQEKGIMFDNFNPTFLSEQGVLSKQVMPDLLHPNQQGYQVWAKQLQPYVEKYVKD